MIRKGNKGYLAQRKKIMLACTLLLLAANLIMFFVSKAHFGTNRNIFSIMCALICLPIGKLGVSTVMFFRAKGCSEQSFGAIRKIAAPTAPLYDLFLTSYQKNYQISAAFIFGKMVIALSEDAKIDVPGCEKHIRTMLTANELRGYTVKVFTKLSSFLERIEECSRMYEGEEETEEHLKVRVLLKSISI